MTRKLLILLMARSELYDRLIHCLLQNEVKRSPTLAD
jgi:hypothetical protein